MNRFMTKDLMVAVLPGDGPRMACDGNSMEEARCDGNSMEDAECDGNSMEEVRCDGNSMEEAECDGNSMEEARCDGNSMEDHYRGGDVGPTSRERDYELLRQQLDTVLTS